MDSLLDKALKGTVVNWSCHFKNGKMLEITL